MGTRLQITRTILVCTGLLACGVPPMPEVSVRGDASHVLLFDEWKQIVGMGRVVKWSARVTRRSGEPIGEMAYSLYDDRGTELVSGGLDYRTSYQYVEPFKPGDSLRLGVPAFRDSTSAHTVSRIVITVTSPGRAFSSASKHE